MAPTCCARLLSDIDAQTECSQEATSRDGKFCPFHAWQCHALYQGYKRRNGLLDSLELPAYLANTTRSLIAQDFNDITQTTAISELQRYLFRRYTLLDRVLRARKLHHRHFFAMDNNYGHTVYLDRLQNNKHETVKALEKLGKRAAAVVHEEQRWHHWVRECQEKEEEQAQSEAKKVKLEFQLFKRYEKELDRRQRDMRSREIKRREEQYLNQVYAERAQTMSREEEEEWEEQWDPIQDIYGYERGRYVELINMFLMISEQEHEDYCAGVEASQLDGPAAPTSSHQATGQAATGKKSIIMETKEQMRRRLQTPVNFERAPGQYLPEFLSPRTTTPVVPHDEIETLLDEICEIKNFLFCRLLLASSALLPIALQAGSIEELLQSEGVTREHLRDVCLKLERPSLENMRDACADFMRERDGADAPKDIAKDLALMDIIDAQQRIQIRVCGRHMYYYRNERALNRSGWFHFSIIAKDSELADAVALCRNWEEFFELTILSMYRLFPAPKWTKFVGDVNRQCLLLLGFIPYFQVDGAEAKTTQHRISGRASSGRSFNFKESRNILCGIVKRDDTLNRRFLECLAMESADLRVLVHDPVTGKFVIQPPKEEFWLSREKAGRGRSTKHEYTVTVEVDNAFFEQATACRAWSLNFNDYYNVYIWDAPPGRSADELQGKIQEAFLRTHKCRKGKDMLVRVRHIVQHITNDRENRRVRSIRPGENVPSMLDDFELGAEAFPIPIDEIYKERFFTEIDEIEDALLYPRRAPGDKSQPPFPREIVGKIHRRTKWKWWKIASDASTDEESSASDEESFASDDASEAKSDEGSQKMNDPRAVLLRRMLANDPHVSVLAGKAIDKLPSKRELDAFGNHGTLIPQFQWADRSLGYDHFLPMFDRKRASVIPSELRDSPSKLMDTLRTALRRQREYDIQGKHLIRELCGSHGQRSIHRVEKEALHMGDLEPGGLGRYMEHKSMVTAMDKFVMSDINTGPFELCKFMHMAPLIQSERRIVDEAFQAYAAIALFYQTEEFLASEHGLPFRSSLLFDQEERAKRTPDRRSHVSNPYMPAELWTDRDELLRRNQRSKLDPVYDIYPIEWRKRIRTVVMTLYKAGIIQSAYTPQVKGVATAAAEPNRALDFYLDFRAQSRPKFKAVLADPTPLNRDYIVKAANKFAAQHGSARFSALRLWSAPHFYPMQASGNETFADDRGRYWAWRYMPKDSPLSEWNTHKIVSDMMEQYRRIWGNQVRVARDLILVMGKDADECRRLSEGVTWATQTRRVYEMDFWRSFVNVDAGFLERLHPVWLS